MSGSKSHQPSPDSSHGHAPKVRASRVSRACDFCHKRSIRCRTNEDGGPCRSCVEYGRECTYTRTPKKRGVKSTPRTDTDVSFHAPELIDQATLIKIAEVYFETIYPVFPFFHRQTLLKRIEMGEHQRSPSCYSTMMSVCALTVARIRDGAPYSNIWSTADVNALPKSDTLVRAVYDVLPKGPDLCENFDYLRCCGLLALTNIQNGRLKEFHYWLGTYCTLLRLDSLQNEDAWPDGLSRIEVEERRRYFWSMYSLEIFSAACFDTPMYCREEQSRVCYPEAIDDDVLEEQMSEPVQKRQQSSLTVAGASQLSWLQGWNFVTDLYRVLEHAIDQRRMKESGSSDAARLFQIKTSPPGPIISAVLEEYNKLPDAFKEIQRITFDRRRDIFGFQAANITATMQLMRMVLFTYEVATDEERCSIVQEVLQTFAEVPVGYLKAISTPLVIHLGGIGRFLNPIVKHSLSKETFELVRHTLLALANLLQNLGDGTLVGDEPSRRIRAQVDRMEAYRISSAKTSMAGPDSSFPSGVYNEPISSTGFRLAASTIPSPPPSSTAPGATNASSSPHNLPGNETVGPLTTFPPEMFEDWTWAFDFAQKTSEDDPS